jgi:hypothetical protein
VTGIEPVTPCLQSRSTMLVPLSTDSDNLLHGLRVMVASTLLVSHPFGCKSLVFTLGVTLG